MDARRSAKALLHQLDKRPRARLQPAISTVSRDVLEIRSYFPLEVFCTNREFPGTNSQPVEQVIHPTLQH